MLCKNVTSCNLSPLVLGSGWREAQPFHGQTPRGYPRMGSQVPSSEQTRRAYSWELAPPRLAPSSHPNVQHWQSVLTSVQLSSEQGTHWMQKPAAAQHIQLHKQKLQSVLKCASQRHLIRHCTHEQIQRLKLGSSMCSNNVALIFINQIYPQHFNQNTPLL